MEKKYRLTEETRETFGHTLHRIEALRDFGNVKKGEKGGWIESEENLSHEGSAWVYNDAMVYSNAQVCNDARVYDDARITDYAWVDDNAEIGDDAEIRGNAVVCGYARVDGNAVVYGYARVDGNAWVYGNARVCGYARVDGDAWVYNDAKVYGNAAVCGNAKVCGYAWVDGDAWVCDNAEIKSTEDIFCVDYIGSRRATTTFYRTTGGDTRVVCGCFTGTIDEFEKRVKEVHGDSRFGKEYRIAIELAKVKLGGK